MTQDFDNKQESISSESEWRIGVDVGRTVLTGRLRTADAGNEKGDAQWTDGRGRAAADCRRRRLRRRWPPGGPAFGDDITFNTEELTVADCTTAWNGSDASNSCGSSVSANGQSMDAATITVGKEEITIDYGLGKPPEVVGAIWWCEVAVDCMPDNKTAAKTLADNLAVSASFSGSKEDVGDLVNNNGALEVE